MLKLNDYVLLILAVLCVLIIIPCSFAGELNENQTVDSLSIDDSVQEDTLTAGEVIYASPTAEDGGDGSSENPYNLSDAVAAYDSNVNSKVILKNGEYKFTSQLNLDKDITLEGESYGGVILNGTCSSAILKASGGNIMLSNLKFVNGYTEHTSFDNYASGLQITYVNHITVDNCIFEKNNNGAISATGSKSVIDIQNCLFDSNFVEYDWSAQAAAIYLGASDAKMNIANTVFRNNYLDAPTTSGAAIYGAMNFESLIIDGCSFINNTADEGSAIYSYCGGNITVLNTRFINQTPSVIYDEQRNTRYLTLFIKNLTFDNASDENIVLKDKVNLISLDDNVKISGNDIDMRDGDDENYTVTLTDADGNPIAGKEIIVNLTNYYNQVTTFTNITNSNGQAIFSMKNQGPGRYKVVASFAGDGDYDSVETTNTIDIRSDEIINLVLIPNSIKIKEGDSYVITGYITDQFYEPDSILDGSSVVVEWYNHNKHALTGAAFVDGSSFTFDIAQCSLKTSDVPYTVIFNVDPGVYEGHVSLIQADLTVDLSVDLPDVGDIDVIYVAGNGSDETGNGSEDNPLATVQLALNLNKALGGGKTIIVGEGTYDISNFNILSDVTIIGQKSKTVFRQVSGRDGMFKIFEPITVDLINITLIDGYTTPMPYSLITAYGEGVIVNIYGCEFRNNTCLNGATIAISHGASVYVDNSRFVDNKCILIQSTGGAIYVLDGYLKVSNSEFVNNTACDGGAIYVGYPGTVDIINSTFTDNIAYNGTVVLGGGGAIYTKGMTKIVNSSFIRNYADLYGGAIYIAGGDAKIFKSYFENNTVGYGTTIKGSAIESEPWTTFNFKMEYSVLITDDTHNDIALFSNNDDSEITLNYNYWGSNTWVYTNTNVPVSDYVIIQPRTSTTPVYKDGEVYIDVEFKNYDTVNKRVTDLYDYVHDYAVEISSTLNNVEYDTVTISNNLAQDKYYANVAGKENILVNGIPLNFNVVESDKKDVNANITILPGNATTIIVQVPDDLANNVSITVKNTEFSKSCGNGTIIVTMNTLPGNYKVVVSYGEDDTYKGFSKTTYFEIPKFPTNINVIVDDIVEEQSAYVDINVTKGATGNLVIIINGKYRYESVIENGTSFKEIYDLPVGNYTVDVFYDGDEYHAPANASTTFKVSERPVEPDEPIDGYAYIFVKTGDLTTITVRVPSDLSKNVTITVNDDVYSKESGNGTITLTIPTGEGDYSVAVNYDGDEKYNPFSESYMFKIYDCCWFINETGYRTLREAVEAAGDGDVIKGNISVYETDETVNIGHREIPSEPWEIVKNITITSMTDNPVTIKGHSHRLFYIDKDSHLTLSNLILTGSDVGYLDGGAVENTYDAYVTIKNCTFTNFNADRGGALFLWGKAEVIDSVFINNNAEIGGAIFVLSPVTNDNNVIFENVTLINNTADSYGAGMYISGSTYNTTFVNNSRFINNTGHGKGGAIYVESGNVKIENTLFDSNKAIHYDFDAEVELAGGAVFISRYANVNISNTQFLNNYAEEYGGALACDNTILMFQDVTTGETDTTYYFTNIVGCSFINNTAGISAGAIYLGFNSLPTVTIVNSTFDSNGAPEAGVISTNFADLLISDCEFKNNVASGASLITTYGTYSDDRYDATTRIVGSKFTNNNVKYVINQLNMYTILTVEDSVFYEDAVILINKGSATLNNLTQERTNNDYAVVNNGTLSLNKNDFINPISNGGTISSETYIVVLNNETISVEIGSTYILRAIICDDNGNIIEKGNLVFIVNGEEVNANYVNIGFIADYEVGNGSYLISARYSDSGLTKLKVKTAQIIAKKSIDMLINMENITVGQDVTITVNVPSQVSGNISVKIGDNISVLPIKNGEARFVISGVESGDYAVEIVYSGNDDYASKIEVVNLTVFKINDYTFDVDVSDITADSAVIDINLPEDYNGNVTLSIDGKNQSVVIDNGKANVYIDNLTIGSHTAEVIFEGNEKYAGDKFTIPFTVSKYESFVKISVNDIVVGNSAIINLILPDDATGDVIITVNNKTQLVTAGHGSAILLVPNLGVGNYTVYANYIGDNKYLDSENSTSFNVVDSIKDTVIELSISGNNVKGILREVNGNPISEALISYGIGDILNKEVITGLNGEFVVSANSGDRITFRYAGNNMISSSAAVITLDNSTNEGSIKKDVVIEVASKFSSIAVDTGAGEKGAIFYATIKDSNGNVLSGKSVKIQVGKSQYNAVSDNDGKVAIQANFNAAGTYNYVLSFDGDDQYNKSPLASAKLTVSKKKTSISAKAKKFKANNKVKKYTVALKTVKNKYDGKTYLKAGMKLTLKVKGKTYSAKINKKGKATFKIKKLSKKGKYKATIKFKGDKTYNVSSKKVTIKIR